jgi:hypothetical protein
VFGTRPGVNGNKATDLGDLFYLRHTFGASRARQQDPTGAERDRLLTDGEARAPRTAAGLAAAASKSSGGHRARDASAAGFPAGRETTAAALSADSGSAPPTRRGRCPEPRASDLPLEDVQLMPKNEDLHLLRPFAATTEHEQLEQATNRPREKSQNRDQAGPGYASADPTQPDEPQPAPLASTLEFLGPTRIAARDRMEVVNLLT